MKTDSPYETYPLYLWSSGIMIAILSCFWMGLQFLLWPGLLQLGYEFALMMEGILFLLPLYFIGMLCIMLLAVTGMVTIHPLLMRLSNRSLYVLFPFFVLGGTCFGIQKDCISQSLIDLINHLVGQNLYKIDPARLLILTPHCLQKNTCVHKVTNDVSNCKECGQCQVGTLLGLAKTYGCQFIVVTGGTLARLKVKECKPKAIIAIACERDLVSGMQDVFPIPVLGVLNERPFGPCCNTRVDIDTIETMIKRLIIPT